MHIKNSLVLLSVGAASLALASCSNDSPDESVALADIQEDMWTSMESSESVTVTVDIPSASTENSAAQTEAMVEKFGADFEQMSVSGAMNSTATSVSLGSEEETEQIIRLFDETAYMSTEFLINNVQDQMGLDEDQAGEGFADLASEYSDMWLDVPPESAGADGVTPADLIADLRAGWEAEGEGSEDDPVAGPMDAANLPAEGKLEERNGTDVWVFAGEDNAAELVVAADEDAPRILSARDGEITMTFSEWNAAALPEEPLEDEIADEYELNEQIMGLY